HVPHRMSATLLAALWAHLAACVLLMGSCCFLLLAGCPRTPTAFRWDERIAAWCRLLVLAAIFSGVVWLLARTAVFENRPDAALEARAVWHVVPATWRICWGPASGSAASSRWPCCCGWRAVTPAPTRGPMRCWLRAASHAWR